MQGQTSVSISAARFVDTLDQAVESLSFVASTLETGDAVGLGRHHVLMGVIDSLADLRDKPAM